MYRLVLIAVVLAVGAGTGLAQSSGGIQWQNNPQQAVALAQRTQRPLMFYVLASSRDRDDRLERAQRRALADPRVLRLAQRFIPVRLSRSRHRDLLEQLHLRPSANMEMSFVAPDGSRLDSISATGVANADSLAQKLALVFNFHRQRVFDRDLRPVLENKEAKPAELQAALNRIQEFTILGADSAVVKLLGRENLDPKTASLCYDVLAHLSTKIAVEKLLDLSFNGNAKAANTLTKCTPAAAEMMLPQIVLEDGAIRVDIYRAATRICRIKKVKSDKWWAKAEGRRRQHEIDRVKEIVAEVSKKWKAKYEEYR